LLFDQQVLFRQPQEGRFVPLQIWTEEAQHFSRSN
jgi:hypothetical protein